MNHTITRRIEIDAAHRVPFHESKCRHLHGHRYVIIAVASAPVLVAADTARSDAGMVVDFGVLKSCMMSEVHDVYDHRCMLWEGDPMLPYMVCAPQEPDADRKTLDASIRIVPCIPTAEELARLWYTKVAAALTRLEPRVQLTALRVYETPNCSATYEPTNQDR